MFLGCMCSETSGFFFRSYTQTGVLRNYPHSFSYISNVQDLFPMRSAGIARSVPFEGSTEEVIVNELIFQKFHVAAIDSNAYSPVLTHIRYI